MGSDQETSIYCVYLKRDSLTVSALASYAVDPGSNPGVSPKKMERLNMLSKKWKTIRLRRHDTSPFSFIKVLICLRE